MDTKLKNFSHSLTAKIITFIIVVLCFTGVVKSIADVEVLNNGHFGIVFEENYFQSRAFMIESETILRDLTRLTKEYMSQQHILQGGTIDEDELRREEAALFSDYQVNSRSYNPNLSENENYEKFKAEYADRLAQARDRLIKQDLREYNLLLKRLEGYQDIFYYASDGTNVFSNSIKREKEYFKTYPSYMLFEQYDREFYPEEIKNNQYIYRAIHTFDDLYSENNIIYLAFTDKFLNPRINEWKEDKVIASNILTRLIGFLLVLILSFVYLVLVTGRKSFADKELHLNPADKIYNDIKVVLMIVLLGLWIGLLEAVGSGNINKMVIPITIPIFTVGLLLVLSLIRHLKNGTLLKNTLVFSILFIVYKFIRDVYNSGSIGIKTVLLVVGYPLLVASTFFMFPVTLGAAAWLAFRQVKSFNAIKEGVERIKAGDLHHTIDVAGNGEFGKLAADINSITDGLKKAVENELKSERLKTELITNVSHDIRTPLTSIITYVDLLKNEKDPSKAHEYLEVLDQKSQRLKILTDDLFEAAKASSGSIPVNFERLNIVSLLTQGLGELNDKIETANLEFKLNYPKENLYVTADGKLLWRAIENLLSNIFKYALKGSRVYIDIEDQGNDVLLIIKNISAYELNITADELMERFKRGDESRSSQGSGLGLSIAKSLIDMQRGKFDIQVDGDLFKAIISLPKSK